MNKGHFVAVHGHLGASKTMSAMYAIIANQKRYPWAPVASTTPLVLTRPGTLFELKKLSDLMAFGIVFSVYVRSGLALLLSETIRGKLRRRSQEIPFDPALLLLAMRQEFEEISNSVRWQDRHALDRLVDEHNRRVMSNSLVSPAIDYARAMAGENPDIFEPVDYIMNPQARFEFAPVWAKTKMLLDEGGIFTPSSDNASLKDSGLYYFMANLRRFGIQIVYTAHDPSNVWVQMRRLTDLFVSVRSFNIKGGRKLVILTGYNTPEDFDEGKKIRYFDWMVIPPHEMGRYSTVHMVAPPAGVG